MTEKFDRIFHSTVEHQPHKQVIKVRTGIKPWIRPAHYGGGHERSMLQFLTSKAFLRIKAQKGDRSVSHEIWWDMWSFIWKDSNVKKCGENEVSDFTGTDKYLFGLRISACKNLPPGAGYFLDPPHIGLLL